MNDRFLIWWTDFMENNKFGDIPGADVTAKWFYLMHEAYLEGYDHGGDDMLDLDEEAYDL